MNTHSLFFLEIPHTNFGDANQTHNPGGSREDSLCYTDLFKVPPTPHISLLAVLISLLGEKTLNV